MSAEQLVAELVSIDSVNPDLVPGGAGEEEIAAFVAGWRGDGGLEVELVESADGRAWLRWRPGAAVALHSCSTRTWTPSGWRA